MINSYIMSATQRVKKPILIGVAGGTASGKSTVCQKIMDKLSQDCKRRVAMIKQDSFYRELTDEEFVKAKKGDYNFDHPSALDEQRMYRDLKDILDGIPVRLPVHDYIENLPKKDEFTLIDSADVVLVEGVLIFYYAKVRDLFSMKLFVDLDSDTRLSRRVTRDVKELKRTLEWVLDQYDRFVKPAFEEFCQPTKKYADVIIPRGAENEVAIGLINHNVTYLLSDEMSALRNGPCRFMHLRAGSPPAAPTLSPDIQQLVENHGSLNNHSLSQVNPTLRSRSNSYVSSAASFDAAQQSSADIKEEQETLTPACE